MLKPTSQINTLMKVLREKRTEAKLAGEIDRMKKIDFIGKSINKLLASEIAS